jgi:hypothetical protein
MGLLWEQLNLLYGGYLDQATESIYQIFYCIKVYVFILQKDYICIFILISKSVSRSLFARLWLDS